MSDKYEKLRKRLIKLSLLLDEMAPQDVEAMRKSDLDVDRACRNITDMIGASNPYWRVHPLYPNIRCSINGEIDISGQEFSIREFGGMLKVCYSNSRKRLSAPDLIMACFDPCPGIRSEWRICYKDYDYRNIKPSNMYWERVFV